MVIPARISTVVVTEGGAGARYQEAGGPWQVARQGEGDDSG